MTDTLMVDIGWRILGQLSILDCATFGCTDCRTVVQLVHAERGRLDLDLHGPAHTPFWPDKCPHNQKKDFFLGTTTDNGNILDVYIFQQPGRQEVCLRYGRSGNEYVAPGEVHTMMTERWINAGPMVKLYLAGRLPGTPGPKVRKKVE